MIVRPHPPTASPGAGDSLTLVVDGNNVMGARADGWWRDRPAAARRLLARVQCYAARVDHPVVVVFDVPQADLPEGEHGGVAVRYARRPGRDAADDRIVADLEEAGPGRVELVTSDRELARRARAQGAVVTGAGAFLARLDRAGC
ncbi:MAG TPA: NYN domain-containing protein [Acidimicrobiales bacterium]|nr:NYN domain-containing protein [Acidimicrobiales bacterium]